MACCAYNFKIATSLLYKLIVINFETEILQTELAKNTKFKNMYETFIAIILFKFLAFEC